jgi:outer membrane protein OmpA-like peptidoglycan-associated protein
MDTPNFGPLKPYIDAAGYLMAAGLALTSAIVGKKINWAPRTEGLLGYAASISCVGTAVGLAVLYHLDRSVLDAPNFLKLALCFLVIGVVCGAVYLFAHGRLAFTCEEGGTEYAAGLLLRPEAKKVLAQDLAGLPKQYAKIEPPLPTSPREWFCALDRTAADADFIWRGGSRTLAKVLLFLTYFFTIVPLTLALASAAISVTQVAVEKTPTGTKVDLPSDVLFDFEKAILRADALPVLERIAADLRKHGVRSIRVEGHTDGRGGPEINQPLSEQRAQVVAQWLRDKGGLSNVTITTVGYGARQPIARETTDDGKDDPGGRAKNRRVSIVIDDQV